MRGGEASPVKTRAVLLLCGVSLALVTAAAAEPATPAPPAGNAAEGLPPARILAIVRANGFDPMGAPVRKGDVYAVRALDPDDIVYRIVLDADRPHGVDARGCDARPVRGDNKLQSQ